DFGRTCERCRRLREECACPAPVEPPPAEQTARVARERRKNGKEVTVVRGLAPGVGLERLGKTLRAKCGAGGTVKDGEVEVQGDHRERVAAILRELGYGVKAIS